MSQLLKSATTRLTAFCASSEHAIDDWSSETWHDAGAVMVAGSRVGRTTSVEFPPVELPPVVELSVPLPPVVELSGVVWLVKSPKLRPKIEVKSVSEMLKSYPTSCWQADLNSEH